MSLSVSVATVSWANPLASKKNQFYCCCIDYINISTDIFSLNDIHFFSNNSFSIITNLLRIDTRKLIFPLRVGINHYSQSFCGGVMAACMPESIQATQSNYNKIRTRLTGFRVCLIDKASSQIRFNQRVLYL